MFTFYWFERRCINSEISEDTESTENTEEASQLTAPDTTMQKLSEDVKKFVKTYYKKDLPKGPIQVVRFKYQEGSYYLQWCFCREDCSLQLDPNILVENRGCGSLGIGEFCIFYHDLRFEDRI
eukprot:GHVP01057718.1.p1 GENE.GHVP01057718.1~~GHVP01057718.1.p1  ORF type:complete len:123 (+),score=14.86 GHVP01057718.1:2-370(+)